jgi:hypothetical protein
MWSDERNPLHSKEFRGKRPVCAMTHPRWWLSATRLEAECRSEYLAFTRLNALNMSYGYSDVGDRGERRGG